MNHPYRTTARASYHTLIKLMQQVCSRVLFTVSTQPFIEVHVTALFGLVSKMKDLAAAHHKDF